MEATRPNLRSAKLHFRSPQKSNPMKESVVHVVPSGPLVAMVGNPNAGKTALFNALTGSNQKVANYSGVTVERVEGKLVGASKSIRVLDLPGTYSFHPRSPDERVTCDVLRGQARGERCPDICVCVVDATNLRRGLKLVLGAQQLGLSVVVAVNMMDRAAKRGMHVSLEKLSAELGGVPVVGTVAIDKKGTEELVRLLSDTDRWAQYRVEPTPNLSEPTRVAEIMTAMGLDQLCPDTLTERIDRFVMHPVLGPLVLFSILFVVFQAVFAWAAKPMEWIEGGFGWLGEICATYLPDGIVKDILVDAVIGGVGGVAVFLPQIVILFFFILLMEESGYLPRAAFLLDRTMGGVGLSGRSFLSLLSGYACAVPAIMASRIVGNQRDRWATIAIAPLLTCSARLPVYTVMIGAFVPNVTVMSVGLQGLVLFALYMLGTGGALCVAWVMSRRAARRGERRTLMLELPCYHMPRWRPIAHGLWTRAWIYLQKVGTVILGLTVILWVLTTFPGAPDGATEPAINYSFAGQLGQAIEPIFAPIGFNWQMCVSLIPAMGAREVAVAALGTIYAVGGEAEDALIPIVQQVWSIPMGLSYLAFFVFSPSCLATLAAIKREMNSWKAPIGLWFAYMALSYAFAYIV